MNRTTTIALACLCLALGGCGSQSDDSSPKKDAESAKLVKVESGNAVQLDADSIKLSGITVETAGRDKLTSTLQPTGEVQPTDTGAIQVTSRLPGKITDALVSVGDRVHKGQTIAYVDSVDLTTAESAYQTAVSHETLSKHQLDQQHRLAGFGSLSEQAVEDAHRASAAADAAVRSDEAQIKVDKLALESTKKLVDMGEITRKPVEDAQNAYAQAQAAQIQAGVSLNSAKKNLDRTKILFQGGVFSQQQMEDAETAYMEVTRAQ